MTGHFVVRAPGRVNLIGEHTDYNQGYVLPVAIDLELRLAGEATGDRRVELSSTAEDRAGAFSLDAIGQRSGAWVDYPAGVARQLLSAGIGIGGFRGKIDGNLPSQAGLSSSAAVELAVAWALMAGAISTVSPAVDPMQLARLCQRAENDYVGVNCGLMDQFAVSCGVAGHALLLDCRSLEYRPVTLPDTMDMVVVQTGAPRRLLASEYNERRRDCERAVALLAARGHPVKSLRDATHAMLDEARPELGEQAYRRCLHVLDENERTLAAVGALEASDTALLRDLFSASHASLRDLFEVSSPELNLAVEVALATPGVIAARMTGAGFGGCTINLVERGGFEGLRASVERDYVPQTGLPGRALLVHAAAGAGFVADSAVA